MEEKDSDAVKQRLKLVLKLHLSWFSKDSVWHKKGSSFLIFIGGKHVHCQISLVALTATFPGASTL